MNTTRPTRVSDIKREWHLIDVKHQVLGRVSGKIAKFLMGKSKPYFVRNLDCGDYVVVINVKEVSVTGKKEERKRYYRHSGFPGGLKVETFRELRTRKPEETVCQAVKGMLPQNKLRDKMLKRLLIFEGEEHPYKDKFEARSKQSETV